MNFFELDTSGTSEKSYVFLGKYPEGLELYTYCAARGEAMTPHAPSKMSIPLEAQYPGIQVPSIVGNALKYLIVDEDCLQVFRRHSLGRAEILPLEIINHKGRSHSDCWIINPLDVVDCVDLEESKIVYLDDDPSEGIVAIEKLVLDPSRVDPELDLFRVPESPETYIVSVALADSLRSAGSTNLVLSPIELTRVDS